MAAAPNRADARDDASKGPESGVRPAAKALPGRAVPPAPGVPEPPRPSKRQMTGRFWPAPPEPPRAPDAPPSRPSASWATTTSKGLPAMAP
ncbi:MAG TPA: hypothetical protein VHB21_05695, partial [Minicystis sp.]|nr:hypothetical protein [Minicystis sp.]